MAQDELPLPAAPLAASLMENLRAQERERKDTHLRNEDRERERERERARERASTGSFVLRVFICFLKAGILGEVSGEGLNRIFLSFPGMSL